MLGEGAGLKKEDLCRQMSRDGHLRGILQLTNLILREKYIVCPGEAIMKYSVVLLIVLLFTEVISI
ncbi:MAG: hypothetical protein JXR90_15415, partial [Spirochaetes bacterium]|nr:hypothetical protein [Spirochaetota bacterium]